jgi:hypothetical protein
LAEKFSVGAGVVTVIVTLCVFVPPSPVQARVNEVVAVSTVEDSDPEVALAPDQPPLAEQAVAFVELQVSTVDSPEARVIELAESETVGGDDGVEPEPLSPPPPQAASRVIGNIAKSARNADDARVDNTWLMITEDRSAWDTISSPLTRSYSCVQQVF